MSVTLKKGGGVSLKKSITNVSVSLYWQEPYGLKQSFDLDVTAFVLNSSSTQSKVLNDSYMVFYNQTSTPCGAVVYSGDARSGASAASTQDCETINIDLTKLPVNANEISFVVTLHEADARKQSLDMLQNGQVVLTNNADNTVIATYHIENRVDKAISIQLGSLTKESDAWQFKSIDARYPNVDLLQFCKGYGVTVSG
jgi:tellurium resistance protein TerD